MKLFESKFQGSLQKLDAFEKEWFEIKTTLQGGICQTLSNSTEIDPLQGVTKN